MRKNNVMKDYEVLVKAIINGTNEIQLIKEKPNPRGKKPKFSLLWGEKGNERLSKTVLRTPTGRIMSEAKSRKMFIKAIDTARYFTFKKMTLEEILEISQNLND